MRECGQALRAWPHSLIHTASAGGASKRSYGSAGSASKRSHGERWWREQALVSKMGCTLNRCHVKEDAETQSSVRRFSMSSHTHTPQDNQTFQNFMEGPPDTPTIHRGVRRPHEGVERS